jgi:alkylated DNA repair protein (DNA oxidative demethylase)
MTLDLFADQAGPLPSRETLGPGAIVLRGFAINIEDELLNALQDVVRVSPFRYMITPGGYQMSVAMTNCGTAGWVTDKTGYRYDPKDPLTGKPWPAMPVAFSDLARCAATEAGFSSYSPNVCLVNQYEPGAKLSLHQDKDELDFTAPIVSVSLGLPAIFLFGGAKRSDKTRRIQLVHGDVVVWGGPTRLYYHGILPLKDGDHPKLGRYRINLTFRKAN